MAAKPLGAELRQRMGRSVMSEEMGHNPGAITDAYKSHKCADCCGAELGNNLTVC